MTVGVLRRLLRSSRQSSTTALFARTLANQPFYPDPVKRTEKSGFPVCLTPVGRSPLFTEIHREDVFRFFSMCSIKREDIIVQYSSLFLPQSWWIRFSSEADREKALAIGMPLLGGKRVKLEKKNMEDWHNGTYNHLVGKTLGSALLVSRLSIDTSPEDIASFFRNFHLQGNGVTLLQDAFRPNIEQEYQFRRAIVKLISPQEAQRAARALHRKFLRNNMVSIRVLQ